MATPAKPRQSGIPGPGRSSTDALKANDPSNHRNPLVVNSASLSPQSISHLASSGRRSVAGRPPSASSSSAKIQERSRTPTSARTPSRPPSRQSELSKPTRTFEVGDNVRIESLGFEGVLRYMGEIGGKPGLWAGVELSGGFIGKGKNNGSVGGKQYFTCPDKCGVFVATTKLSPPTVGPGALQRPSSVASSRGGTTASTSGRVTPSISNGRTTPSSVPMQRPLKTPSNKSTSASLSDKITAGSRASKYITMTAEQLSSTSHSKGQGSDKDTLSPSAPRALASPIRPVVSPFATPKAVYSRQSNTGAISPTLPSTRSRPSVNTPRARIPSGVAMPPPPSPVSRNGQFPIHGENDPASERHSLLASTAVLLHTISSPSQDPGETEELSILDQLQSRLDAAEYENERLRAAVELGTSGASPAFKEQVQTERQEALDKYTEVQDKVNVLQERLVFQANELGQLREEKERLLLDLSEAASQQQQALAAHQLYSEEHSAEMKLLQRRLSDMEDLNLQKDESIVGQTLKVEELTTNFQQSYLDFQEEKRELTMQVDELRVAGQETIALYEERLSVANAQRYELEQRVLALEASLHSIPTTTMGQEPFPNRSTSSATQIDNETLRDQVQHLQKKSTKLEEQLEEARATLERDLASYQDKIARVRLEDEQRKRDLASKTREVEELKKSETHARSRVEEIEEALRESTVALENTRIEVESLRTELANLDILIDDATEGEISSKLANFTKKVSADKAQYQREIKRLEQSLLDSRAENALLQQRISDKVGITNMKGIENLNEENQALRCQIDELEVKLSVASRPLEDQVDSIRKKANRDFALPNGTIDPSKAPSTRSEEVAGLKHIVQELQKETLASAQHIKLLESENALLAAEAEQLRQDVHFLEANLDKDKSMIGKKPDNGTSSLPHPSLEQRLPIETDLDQMRKRLSEAEMKHARIVHDLNKEISELEALVESKRRIQQDELEQEIERLKDKLSRQKKTSKPGNENVDSRHRTDLEKSEEVCEICERPGHDIFNCSLLKDDTVRAGKDLVVCEDCESPGHVAADCPHSSDVF
ncbi:hypothetical protein CPB84DRAFT_1837197 [Gymnopilus junonius]|uniref:CAP-Gly domain-containing protein n=1 Tax=Gymnopilus junonius TaxID=109634 RepID=A0A9P5TMG8_GYMJU|nr:hypothetical protein CPB84DRAFT_1837197 [Gymnopilus junonius]